MTESEWLAATDPIPMLIGWRSPIDKRRKLALFAFAGYRLILESRGVATPEWVVAAERAEDADGSAADDKQRFERDLRREEAGVSCLRELQQHAILSEASDLVRDIFGNPFRPVAIDSSWRTSAVVGLAQGIYDDRAFDRMPVLADALEDAGCTDADVLGHCRGDGPHARGCWVVDAILGKE